MTRRVTSLLSLVVFLLIIALPAPVSASSDDPGKTNLSFAERVSGREAVEDVLWAHRIWPEENPTPKPERWEIVSREHVAAEVTESLLHEAALLELWNVPLDTVRVQAELDRIGEKTKRPEILLEIFAALDNDPQLVAECFVRPQLAERLLKQRYAAEGAFHQGLPSQPEATPAAADRRKRPFDEWWNGMRTELIPATPEPGTYTIPAVVKCRYCNDDGWTPAPGLPDFEMSPRRDHTAVWTGNEMIVWGGEISTNVYTDSGGRYDPVTDVWTSTTTSGAPAPRRDHTAVWTGTEMIIFGGWDGFFNNTGARYNPATDTWAPVTDADAPAGCINHSAVWTGAEMIVWGGTDATYNKTGTGARYDPSTDTWTATETTGAPGARDKHHAAWTGIQMIVWGGQDDTYNETNTGGRYDPTTDSWTETSTVGPPSARYGESAVWTGTELIVWGGVSGGYINTGGRYNPTTDSWAATSTSDAPSARQNHTAVWSGTEMVIWGGNDLDTGGRYNPATDTWTATSTTEAPRGRSLHTAVWTGSEMVIWGNGSAWTPGELGKRYDPTTDSWTAMNQQINAPTARGEHSAVWLGTEMIIWGGSSSAGYFNDGSTYSVLTDSWTPISSIGAPPERTNHSAVWTGTEMIVWGGYSSGVLNSGGRYNPSTDTWTATNLTGAPSERAGHAAVWTGTEMLIWAGSYVNTGGKYNPATDTWTATSVVNAPPGLTGFAYAWTGNILVVWGGQIPGQPGGTYANWGGRYNPAADMWFNTSTVGAPSARVNPTATWTGSEVIIWGGYTAMSPDLYPAVGGRYNPNTDSWITMGASGAPLGRYSHTALWTGQELLVWGGNDGEIVGTGGRYDPAADTWFVTNDTDAAVARHYHSSVWTGSEMLVWGGTGVEAASRNGGLYCASGVSDHVPPTDPYISGAVPVPGSWTSDNTIRVYWSGSTDSDSGVAGYSVLLDQNASTTPDDTVEVAHTADPHSIEMPAVASGNDWVFHVKACDNAGNCSGAIHFGPYWIDTIDPTAPGSVTSSSHDGGSPVSDATIDAVWGASTDADSGLSNYRYEFLQSATPPACTALWYTTGGTTTTSSTLTDGTWYLHVCAQDGAQNSSDVATGGPYVVDTGAPSNPSSLASTSHTAGAWSQTAAVAMQWSGASDSGGLSGYSLVFDTSAGTLPDNIVDLTHTTDPHSTISGPLVDGDSHYFHLVTCDQADNCSTAAHAGPFWIDATAPGAPGAVSSPSHGAGPTTDSTIDVVWGSAVDATSLIDGYSFAFDHNVSWTCETTKEVEEVTTTATSTSLAAGDWYFHVCAVDYAGNWGPVTSGGPYVVNPASPPPTVTNVGSVADTGDGTLEEGEQTEAPLTQLLVSFSAAMNDPAGDTSTGDVTNPASYRLIGDGGDGTVATLTCGSVDPSDTAVTIEQVTYDAASDTAALRVHGDHALDPGSYALFACGSEGLADTFGTPLDGTGNGSGGDDHRLGFLTAGRSEVANPNFDNGVGGWLFSGPATITMIFSSDDADNLSTSGSLLLTGTVEDRDVIMVEQCAALTDVGGYRAGGKVRITSGVAGAPGVTTSITLYDAPGCPGGSEVSTGESHSVSGDTGAAWVDLGEVLVWDESAVSARVTYTVTSGTSSDIDVGLDTLNMWFDPAVLSADGFELGDTNNWSAVHD